LVPKQTDVTRLGKSGNCALATFSEKVTLLFTTWLLTLSTTCRESFQMVITEDQVMTKMKIKKKTKTKTKKIRMMKKMKTKTKKKTGKTGRT